MPCGTSGGYDYVFLGSILSATEISKSEKSLKLIPEEVFFGDVPAELTVTTSQGACLPEIKAGDRWLFYLQKEGRSNRFLMAYGSPSSPVAEAQKGIVTLRRLAHMPDSAIIEGYIQVPNDRDKVRVYSPVPNHKVIAKHVADGVEYIAVTDSNGDYQFEPLPVGSYLLTANTAEGFWAEEGTANVRGRGCSQVGFELLPDHMISGWVTIPSGKPAKHVWVAVTPASSEESEYKSAIVDEHGYFEVKGLQSGRYFVGVGIDAAEGTREWQSRIYYPGVRNRDLAVAVELGQAEQRTEINFRLPASKGP
jgi:hypothetical protein